MGKIKLTLLTLSLLLASICTVKAQTADEIIQKHIEAIGGLENWKKLNSVKFIGSTNMQGMELPVMVTTSKGKGFKMEFTMNGMTGYMIVTDKTGWNYMPMGGQTKPEVLPDEMVNQMKDALDIQGPLFDYKSKGHKVVYLGKDEVEGTECYKIKLTLASGREETMYFDVSNYYHIRSVSKIKANGKEEEETETFGNFQKQPEGVVFPMSQDSPMGPFSIKTVEINKPIADDFFKPKS